MTNKKTMIEVLELEKDTIERLTNEVILLRKENAELKNTIQNITSNIIYPDEPNYKELYQELIIKYNELLENKNNNKDNSSIIPDISLNNEIDELNSKIDSFSNDKNLNIDNNKLDKSILKKKINEAFPTPSSSTENINKISPIPEHINLYEIIYNRYYYKYNYVTRDREGKHYLNCCDAINKDIEFNKNIYITCKKCYRSHKRIENDKLETIVYKEHMINNEKDILADITCINCNKFFKYLYSNNKNKICKSCNIKNNKKIINDNFNAYFYEEVKDDVKGKNVINKFIKKCYNDITFQEELWQAGTNEGLNMGNTNVLVDYVRKYDKNIDSKENTKKKIQMKIIRCHALMVLFNDEKYKYIQNKIHNICFNIKNMALIDEDKFNEFRNYIKNKLDNYLENLNKNEESLFPCKNQSCSDYVSIEGIFCDDCRKDLKPCKNCNDLFWTDEKYVKYCEDCDDDDN